MNKKEWNVIQKELNKYLPKGVSLRYDGIISTKFPEIRPVRAPETYYTDPDYDKGSILRITVGPFDTDNPEEMNICTKHLADELGALEYDVLNHSYGSVYEDQVFYHISFKKPLTYLTDEED